MLKIFVYLLFISSLITASNAESVGSKNADHQYNFYVGNFDFSDHKQKSAFIGFQHQNETLKRKTFLGNMSPLTGGFITENSAAYLYTEVQASYASSENTSIGISYNHISNASLGDKNPGANSYEFNFLKKF